ncbi:MAG TPA: tRNA lysidine(34) synthetase TilS, partial [Casimicrobiaceae bacterium]|nr:tRNA lysidine(34) synthetase TilS [Casimicrobiaceae bacterium]
DSDAQHPVERAVASVLRELLPSAPATGVALSGGRDSIALLDALARVAAGVRVMAFHVHHGLSIQADAWTSFCRQACAERNVGFAVRNVHVDGKHHGVEAAARAARYDALATLAREHGVHDVLLAHHADDQAETLLLQLIRGAGPRGLAAMPRIADERGVRWIRPFLSLPRANIDEYVDTHGLAFVDDESNGQTGYRRNALRAEVVPALRTLAPGYPATLVRAARHQATSAQMLDDLAQIDAGGAFDGRSLDAAILASLSVPRAQNLLRWFLRMQGLRAPSAVRLDAMLEQLRAPRRDARIDFAHDRARVGLYRGRLLVHRRAPDAFHTPWNGAPEVQLAHGTLVFASTNGSGIAQRYLAHARVTIRSGERGERLLPAGRMKRRAVADLLREAGVPQWERIGLPRIYCGDALAAVAQAGIDATFAALPGEAGLSFAWHPAAID